MRFHRHTCDCLRCRDWHVKQLLDLHDVHLHVVRVENPRLDHDVIDNADGPRKLELLDPREPRRGALRNADHCR